MEAVGGCTGLLLGSEPMVFISCDISDEGCTWFGDQLEIVKSLAGIIKS